MAPWRRGRRGSWRSEYCGEPASGDSESLHKHDNYPSPSKRSIKRWFLPTWCLPFPFPLPFFTVPSKPGRGIRFDLTRLRARDLLAAADRVRRVFG